jgi:hypothetical protein
MIYYDRRYRVYVNPKLLNERHPWCEYVCGETARSGLLYPYFLGTERDHAHTNEEVLLAAYNVSEIFSISREYESAYSSQELTFIHKLVEQGKKDRAPAG